jgi:hypothetical protein
LVSYAGRSTLIASYSELGDILGRISKPNSKSGENCVMTSLIVCTISENTIGVNNFRNMRWTERAKRMEAMINVRFQVLTAARMKFRFVFWDYFTRQYIPEDKSELNDKYI